jgi:DNA-binding PadR family transcriptional regulator
MFDRDTHQHPGHGRGRHAGGRHGGDRERAFAYGPRGEFGGPGPFGFGHGGGPRGPFGGGRGRRARRGDIRTAALLLIAEEPRNGYQIMQEVQERSGGGWSPSPGSVYPALQQLEDEGLIRTQDEDGRKLFAITDTGRELLAQRGEDRPAPWEQAGGAVGAHDLGRLMREVASAFMQVMRTGSEGQIAKAAKVLAETRRDLYRILADGDVGTESGGEPEAGGKATAGEQPGTGADADTVDQDR